MTELLYTTDAYIQTFEATVTAHFEDEKMGSGVVLDRMFEQSRYVDTRLAALLGNLLLSGIAVLLVILVMMGWRSALVVGAALPLSAFIVLSGLRYHTVATG